jgi:hypothetical protein
MDNARLVEFSRIIPAFGPIDTNGAGQNGAWVSMENYRRCAIVLTSGAWAGGTIAITLEQAQDATGTGAEALSFDKYYQVFNVADTPEDLASETPVVNGTYNFGGPHLTHVIEMRAADLDITNGFTFLRVQTASPGANADLIEAHYVLYKGGYVGKPENLPTVLS